MDIDFKDIEETVAKRFEEKLTDPDSGSTQLLVQYGKISARIATMVLEEYHRRLQLEQNAVRSQGDEQ
ncbi:hypothetical protein ABH14_03140 [Brevibacillus brevis]|nr:hypothetical protein [Brevibacillus brevis]